MTLKKFLRRKNGLKERERVKNIRRIVREVEFHMMNDSSYETKFITCYDDYHNIEEAVDFLNRKYDFLKFEIMSPGTLLYTIRYEVKKHD